MPVPPPHAESLTAAWKQAFERVTHTAIDPKARRRPPAAEVFFFVTTPVADTDSRAELEAPLEAACLAVVFEVMGLLPRISERERKVVRDAARRAVLAAQPAPPAPMARARGEALGSDDAAEHSFLDADADADADADEADADEADARRLLIALAREGIRALSGARPGADHRASESATTDASGHAWHPPPGALVAMMQGGPDPVAAGGVAVHILRCEGCQAALEIASFADARPVPLRAAAASAPAMLAPGEGRLLARRTNPDAEAFAFDEGRETRIAVYVDTSQPVHYLAEGVTTDDMRPGYWAGRCARSTARVEGTLHVGDAAESWVLDIARD